MANRWGNNGNSGKFYFVGLPNHCRWWLQPWSSKMLAPWKKSDDQLSVLKSIDITLLTKVSIVKGMFFSVVMYGCESWTIKKAECWRIAFELWCWRRLLRVPWTARRSNQSIVMDISPSNEYSGLISFRMDWLDLLTVQGTLKSLLQHHSSKASVLWCSAFFIV